MTACVCYLWLTDKIISVYVPKIRGDFAQILIIYCNEISNC